MKQVCLLVFVISLVCCKKSAPPFGVLNISVEEAKKLIESESDLIILDVRTLEETQEGKLDEARIIDVRQDDFDEKIDHLNRHDTYLVYCRSGSRSTLAVEKMSELGFDRVYMMEGGYLEWKDQSE